MQRAPLADAATTNQTLEQIDLWSEWNEMVTLHLDTLKRTIPVQE